MKRASDRPPRRRAWTSALVGAVAITALAYVGLRDASPSTAKSGTRRTSIDAVVVEDGAAGERAVGPPRPFVREAPAHDTQQAAVLAATEAAARVRTLVRSGHIGHARVEARAFLEAYPEHESAEEIAALTGAHAVRAYPRPTTTP